MVYPEAFTEYESCFSSPRVTILTMALATAYQGWMDQQDKLEQNGQYTGIRKFREKVKEENGNKLIIFDQDHYAIFDAYEVFILCDRNVLMPTGVPEKSPKKIYYKSTAFSGIILSLNLTALSRDSLLTFFEYCCCQGQSADLVIRDVSPTL